MALQSMYDPMDKQLENKFNDNEQHLANMLDFAIQQLVEVAEDHEYFLVDQGRTCVTYDSIFDCLKHWSEKRINQ
jgi:hypothetical protein